MKTNTLKFLLKPYLTIKNLIFIFIIIYTVSPFVAQVTSTFLKTYFYMAIVVLAVALVFGTCRLKNISELVFLIAPFLLFEMLEVNTTDESNILIVGYRVLLFFLPVCVGYYIKTNNVPIKIYTVVTVLVYFITAITTYFGCMRNPGAARTLATIASSQDPIAVFYNWQNIGGYTFVYSAVLLYPALIIAFKRRKFHLVISLLGTAMLFMVSIQAEYALSLTLLIFTTSLYFIKRDLSRDGFIKIAVILIITVVFFSSVLVALMNYVGTVTGNEEMTEKMVAIFSGNDALDELDDNRASLYWFSFNLFLTHPLFGTFPTGYHVTGGHSFILDTLAHYGLVGATLLFLMYRGIFKVFYYPFSDRDGYGFVIYSFLLPIGLSTVNTGMWLQNLCIFMPMFLMMIYGKDFVETKRIPKYPREKPAIMKQKET